MLKPILIAAVAACALFGAEGAIAGFGGDHHGHEGMEFMHSVQLTDLQKAQAHKIEAAGWSQASPLMAQMHALHEQIESALLSPGAVTEAQLSPMVQQEDALRAQLEQQHLAVVLQMRALLTPEQLAQAASVHEKLAALHAQEHDIIHASHVAGQ